MGYVGHVERNGARHCVTQLSVLVAACSAEAFGFDSLTAPHQTLLSPAILTHMGRLLLLFLVIPIAELALLIELGRHIGTLATVALIFVTALLGSYLARQQGLSVLRNMQTEMAQGRLPAGSIIDGVMILLAGAVLITPRHPDRCLRVPDPGPRHTPLDQSFSVETTRKSRQARDGACPRSLRRGLGALSIASGSRRPFTPPSPSRLTPRPTCFRKRSRAWQPARRGARIPACRVANLGDIGFAVLGVGCCPSAAGSVHDTGVVVRSVPWRHGQDG